MSSNKYFIIFCFLLSFFFNPNISYAVESNEGIAAIDSLIRLTNASKPGQTTLERWSEDQMTASLMAADKNLSGDKSEFLTKFKEWSLKDPKTRGSLPQHQISGALSTGTKIISILYTPAASGIQYIASLKDNILGKPAIAQSGFGFQSLQFLLPMWKGFRNIVYVLSAIVFVIIGLMVILRVKISPQAVVTLQSAIPTVITSLILVTFSYAIAGLLIDLSNLIGGIVIALIFNMQGVNIVTNTVTNGGAFPSNLGTQTGGGLSFLELVNPGFGNLSALMMASAPKSYTLMLVSAQMGGVITGMLVGGFFNPVGLFPALYTVGSGVGQVIGGFLGFTVIPFIIGIVIGIWIMQMFFGMLTNYVTVIFKIIFAPIEIGMGAFPNSKVGFGSWFMDVFANIMVFPIITIFFAVLNTITWAIYNHSGGIWAPGPLSTNYFSADNVIPEAVLSALVSLAGLAMASKLPSLIPQYIFMIKPSPFGQAIGENLTPKNMPVVGTVVRGVEKGVEDKMLNWTGGAASAVGSTAVKIWTRFG